MGVSVLAVNIAAIYLDSFLYGIFFLLSLASIYLILRYNKDNGPTSFKPTSILRRPMLLGTILLFLIITAHWVLTFVRFFQAFIYYRGGSAPGAFFNSESELTDIAQISLFLAGLVVSDALFTYRLWVIWNYNTYVAIFPICTVIALLACSVAITYQFSQYTPAVNSTYLLAVARWILSDCVLTLCTNVYCTTMILWRIWTIHKTTASVINGRKKSNLLSIMAAFVESAALCTTWTIFFFITYEAQSNLHVFAQITWATVSGIAFTLITVRIGLGWSTPSTTYTARPPLRIAVPLSTKVDSFSVERITVKDDVLMHSTGTV